MRTIVITGATAGIGLALARQLARERLILVGRRPHSTLSEASFPATLLGTDSAETYCQIDLSQPNCQQPLLQFLDENNITQIDCVIHNAGVGYVGNVATQPSESINNLLQVNLNAPLQLTHALIPYVTRARGQFVFVSSVATGLATPTFAVYNATKAALEGFARSLRVELGNRATVQIVRPGATKTAMHAKVGMSPEQTRRFVSAEKVASQIIRAIERPRRATTLGATNRLLYSVGRTTLPDRVQAWTHRSPLRPLPSDNRVPHCVITGAADGIGKALASHYAQQGYRITGIDIDADRAEQTVKQVRHMGGEMTFQLADLRWQWDWVEGLDSADIFIHNAGINAVGHFAQTDIADHLAVLQLNFAAPLHITSHLLRLGKMTRRSSFVFISSLSHFASYPGAVGYAASKDGIAHYARCLRVALASTHHVLTVYPGPVRTAHARRYSPDNRREQRRLAPDKLANAIFRAQQRRQRTLIPTASAKGVALLSCVAPSVSEWLMRKAILDKLPTEHA